MKTVIIFFYCFINILLVFIYIPFCLRKKGWEGFRTLNPKGRTENSNMKLPKSKNKQTKGVKGK